MRHFSLPLLGAFWFLFFVFGIPALRAEEPQIELSDDWELERIFKSAVKERHHFYQGVVGVHNLSTGTLDNVQARVRIVAPDGTVIDHSKWVHLGSLAALKKSSHEFMIPFGVQFSEIVVRVTYKDSTGKPQVLEFSGTPMSGKPIYMPKGGEEGNYVVQILSCEVEDAPGGNSVVVCRVKNLATIPALKPTLTLTLHVLSITKKTVKTEKSAKKKGREKKKKRKRKRRKHKRSKHHKKNKKSKHGNSAVATDEVENIITRSLETKTLVLDKGSIPPGVTKVYTIPLGKLPRYEGVQGSVSADWGDDATADDAPENDAALLAEAETADGKLIIGMPQMVAPKNGGGTDLLVPIANRGTTISGGAMKINLVLKDGKEKILLEISYTCPEAISANAVTKVRLSGYKIPEFIGYETSYEVNKPGKSTATK